VIYKNIIKALSFVGIVGILTFTEGCQKGPKSPTTFPTQVQAVTQEVPLPQPIALKVGGEEFTVDKFSTLADRYMLNDSTDLKEISREIVFQQLLYKEAAELGYGKDVVMLNELNTYKDIIYEDYQEDSTLINRLSYEAYQNLQSEIEVSHILVYCSEYAELETLNEKRALASLIYEQLLSGEPFGELARQYSDDKNTATNGGYMGWYTGLQLLYPLEVTAYSLKVGDISKPVQTKYGFHIVKLINKRKSRGRVKVSQLLRVVPENNEAVSISQKKTIDSLKTLVNQGTEFEKLVAEYSDDFRTRDNGGLLPEFWIGSRQESVVEEVVFNLKLNEVSAPVKSSAGWHLFKLVEKNPIPNWEVFKEEIAQKVTTDSRGEFIKENWIKDSKTGLNFRPNLSVIRGVMELGTGQLLDGEWQRPKNNEIGKSFLFSIKGESISVTKFYDYMETYQQAANLPANFTPKMAVRYFYQRFEKSVLEDYAKQNLELVNQSFKNALSNYFESLVTKNYLNDVLYNKSMRDSTGLSEYYRKTLQNYQLPERAKILELVSRNQSAIRFIEEQINNGKPYNLKRGISPTLFTKNSVNISEDEKLKLQKLYLYLKRNPNHVVEIGGHSDINEEDYVSAERIRTVTELLTAQGLQITHIKENDFGKTKPADRFDWQKNQRITYRFFSNSLNDLERVLVNQGFEIEIVDDVFTKDEIVSETGIDWKVGSYSRLLDDGFQQKIIIEEIYPSRTKSFNEAKSQVINGYQTELEGKLFDRLLEKYPIDLNEKIVEGIFKKKLNTN
jgi:peptidyl-prolyl cis-trans isomerase SurA